MNIPRILLLMAVSLVLTLVIELFYALLWGVKRRDVPTVILANVLTNPVVVFFALIAEDFFFGVEDMCIAIAGLEIVAFAAEGFLYARRSGIRLPWLFSLCANLFSVVFGILFALSL